MKNEIVLFENQDVKLEVNMKDETVWLSLEQMTKLFDRDKSVISRHIKNALEEELDNSVVANFATTAKDGKTYQVDYYNLLLAIVERFNGGPVGLEALAYSIGEEASTIEDVYEPYLLQQGYLKRTARGRVVTDKTYEYLGIKKD